MEREELEKHERWARKHWAGVLAVVAFFFAGNAYKTHWDDQHNAQTIINDVTGANRMLTEADEQSINLYRGYANTDLDLEKGTVAAGIVLSAIEASVLLRRKRPEDPPSD